MSDVEIMIKALRLAWIPRLLKNGNLNWKTLPDHHFRKYGGLNFLLKCNYRMEEFKDIPLFYRDNELRSLYDNPNSYDTILFNNKEILIGGKPIIFKEWLDGGITIMDLLDSGGHFLSFAEFKSKFHLKKTSFLHFFQVISAIPNHLLERAREQMASSENSTICDDTLYYHINKNSYLDLMKAKAKDFYWILVNKTHTNSHAGPRRWEKPLNSENISWKQKKIPVGPQNR